MREDHYTHGWLPAVLPADARRFRVADETLADVLASVGAEIVEEGPDVEIAANAEGIRGDAQLALVTIDPPPGHAGRGLLRGAKRAARSLGARAQARRAQQVLRNREYRPSVFLWDIRGRAALPFLAVAGRSLRERLPQRAVVLGRRGREGPTALEAALADASRAAGEELRPEWASIRAGVVVVAAGSAILRVAIGGARAQILSQFAALEELERSGAPTRVAERIPWVIAHGRTGLAEWSLERRLHGSVPPRSLDQELLEDCFDFLVALRRTGGGAETERTFTQLCQEPARVAGPETAQVVRNLGEALDHELAGVDRGFAHGDFFAGNLLAEGSRLTGVLDWDGGGPGRVPALDLLHLQLTREPYGSDDDWGRAVVERLLPSAHAGGDDLLRRYCAELRIDPDPRLLEALVLAYWLEYAAYQLRVHPDRYAQPAWIEGNIDLVARAAEAFMTRAGRGDRAARRRTA